MEEIESLAENLALVIPLHTEALPSVQSSEPLFQLEKYVIL